MDFAPRRSQPTAPRCKTAAQRSGIVRNRLKIAARLSRMRKHFSRFERSSGALTRYLWSFVGGKPSKIAGVEWIQVPARTSESDAMSRDLYGAVQIVGSTICYTADREATGMVNDHLVSCVRHAQLGGLKK